MNETTNKNISITRLPDEPLIHDFVGTNKVKSKKKIILTIVLIIAGIISGYFFSTMSRNTVSSTSITGETQKTTGKLVAGSEDNKLFSDSTEGTLEEGGVDGEGTHRLIRLGGESQTVYLTSSVLDLNKFVGRKVKVWGQTFAAKQAGWLMDVGKIETLD